MRTFSHCRAKPVLYIHCEDDALNFKMVTEHRLQLRFCALSRCESSLRIGKPSNDMRHLKVVPSRSFVRNMTMAICVCVPEREKELKAALTLYRDYENKISRTPQSMPVSDSYWLLVWPEWEQLYSVPTQANVPHTHTPTHPRGR